LDVTNQQVVIGHVSGAASYVVDVATPKALAANTDYAVILIFKGTTVSVQVNGAFISSLAFGAPVVDGATGVLSRVGTTSVDSYRLRTNDPAFAAPTTALTLDAARSPPTVGSGAVLQDATLRSAGSEAVAGLASAAGSDRLTGVRFVVAKLADGLLAETVGQVVYVDDDAAGYGWATAAHGGVDLRAVLQHELGHVLGLTHDDADTYAFMTPVLAAASTRAAARTGDRLAAGAPGSTWTAGAARVGQRAGVLRVGRAERLARTVGVTTLRAWSGLGRRWVRASFR
jgi:hypothetical protein